MLELDAKLDEAEAKLRWPELDAQAKMAIAFAARWTGKHGTDTEKKLTLRLELARLVSLGATPQAEQPNDGLIVLHDPEGNELCLLRD